MTDGTNYWDKEIENLLNKLGNPESLIENIVDTLNNPRTGIFFNQIINALRVGLSIKEGNQNMALVASMQSGKSGTIYFLCNYVLPALGMIGKYESAIFVTSMRDKNLYHQNRENLETDYYDAYEKRWETSKIRVKKMSDFFNHPNPYKVVNDYNSNLIIRDEDQYGCGEESSFEQAFFSELKNRIPDIKLLVVSATPYDILDAFFEGFNVDVIEGFRPEDYYGITEMLEDGLVENLPIKFKPLQSQGEGEEIVYSVHPKVWQFVDYLNEFENGLGIIRETRTNRALELRDQIKSSCKDKCEVIAIGSDKDCDFGINEGMSEVKDLILKMNKRVILIIVQALSAGKDLGNNLKDKIRFGIESRDKQLANGAQGIAGRFCGYHKNRKFKVLASKPLLEHYSKFEQDWEVFTDQQWRKGLNHTKVKNLTTQSKLEKTQAEGLVRPVQTIKCLDYQTLLSEEGKALLDFIDADAYHRLLDFFDPSFYNTSTKGTRLKQKGVTVRISSSYNPKSNRVVKNWNCKKGDDFGNIFFKKKTYQFGLLISNYPIDDERNKLDFCGIKIIRSGKEQYRSHQSDICNESMYASRIDNEANLNS